MPSHTPAKRAVNRAKRASAAKKKKVKVKR